jgi:hypothetical protein
LVECTPENFNTLPAIHDIQNLKNDQLEHRARQGKHDGEDKLELSFTDLVRHEKLPHKKDPSKAEERDLRKENDAGVPEFEHFESEMKCD